MTIELPLDLETSIQAALRNGGFASAEELVAQAVRSFLRQPIGRPPAPELGSIGFMRDAGDELDEVVADAYRKRQEDSWREIDLG